MMFIPYLNLYPFSEKLSETKDNLFNYYTKEIQKKFHKIIGGIENNKNIEVNDKMGYYMHGFKLSIYYLKKISQIDPTKEKDLYYQIKSELELEKKRNERMKYNKQMHENNIENSQSINTEETTNDSIDRL